MIDDRITQLEESGPKSDEDNEEEENGLVLEEPKGEVIQHSIQIEVTDEHGDAPENPEVLEDQAQEETKEDRKLKIFKRFMNKDKKRYL